MCATCDTIPDHQSRWSASEPELPCIRQRQVDPRTILYTGLTRDGTFLIENGKISKSIKNFRFNEPPLFMLNNVEAISPAVRIGGTENGGSIVMPALKVRDFKFTSLSDAV